MELIPILYELKPQITLSLSMMGKPTNKPAIKDGINTIQRKKLVKHGWSESLGNPESANEIATIKVCSPFFVDPKPKASSFIV